MTSRPRTLIPTRPEMFNLLGVPSANCPSQNTQFYLDVFQKCSEFCGGNLRLVCRTEDAKLYSDVYQKYFQGCKEVSRERPSMNFNGSPSSADVMRVYSESRKLKSTDAADVFQAYSALCSRGIGGRRSVNVRQTTTVSSSNFIHNNDVRNTGPSTPRGGRNTRANPQVSLTTGEATCSRSIGGRPSVNVRQTTTVSSSNVIHNNDDKEKGKLNDDKEKGKRIMKEVIIISNDDTSFDALVFSNSDSSNDSHDYMSEDSSEALINFLEEDSKPLDVPMQTQEEDLIPLNIVYPHPEIASSPRGTNTRGQAHYGLRSLGPILKEVVVVKKPIEPYRGVNTVFLTSSKFIKLQVSKELNGVLL
ncbi:hypothetical protein Tco_0930989 [Tanacetum coccineum]